MDAAKNSNRQPPLKGPVTVSDFRAKLAEMLDRAEHGEEVVIARGRDPVAKLVPVVVGGGRRLGTRKALLTDAEIAELDAAIDSDLAPDDQRIMAGEGTDEVGIWRGLNKARAE